MHMEVSEGKRVFQIAAWMWGIYLGCMAGIDLLIYANKPNSPLFGYYLINSLPVITFLGLSFSPRLNRQGNLVSPLMILLITAGPILMHYLFDLHLPPAPLSNVEGMILRQLPVLFIGLVLVAWNYSLWTMILYSLATNLFELAIAYSFSLLEASRLSDFYFIILIRLVCFVVIGIYINQLIARLRVQQESLKLANAQLAHYASTLESLTVSRERNRMSRELHDTVVHTLSGLSVQLETVRAYWEVNPGTARNLLDQSLEATRAGLSETRRAIRALRASPLDDLGLVKAIQALAEDAAQRGQLSVETSLPEHTLSLSPDVEQCIYRVAQEAVENVIHHAQAHRLLVRLAVKDQDLDLLVQDDGIGFNPASVTPAGHFGLNGMRERAQLAGGKLIIQSQPNHGTCVHLLLMGGAA